MVPNIRSYNFNVNSQNPGNLIMIETKKYLSLLDANSDKFLFACYDYRKEKKGRHHYGTFDKLKEVLTNYNNDVFCVYVTVNETIGAERKLESIKRARAIWVEDDEKRAKPREDWPLKPSMIIESSNGKFHYYWLTSCKNLDEWDAVMATMVNVWGCDNKAKDRARVLRLPGFKNRKQLDSDFVCRIVEGNGKFYPWYEIKAHFPPYVEPETTADNTSKTGDYSEEKAIQSLLSSENYHGSLVSISMSLANAGISRELQYMTLYGLMQKIPPEKRRPEWAHRISDEHLYECIDSAIKKVEKEKDGKYEKIIDIALKEETPPKREIIFPPGAIGDLCQEILEMAPHPNREIALAGGIGLVAGIVGRRYNVLGMGLNVYVAILADSGTGKAILKDSINLALRAGSKGLNIGAIFAGRSRFTGPKAIFDMLSMGMSRICVIEEAGLVQESKAGDNSGTTRALLDLYTSSGFGKWAGDEGYSSKDHCIPALHSPALSVVNVSTPKSFLTALKNKSAEVSGEVARLWMMRSTGEKTYLNRNKRLDYSNKTIFTLGQLIAECYPYQPADSELVVQNVKVPEKFLNDSDKWVDLENKFMREGDALKRTMCSRAFAKILKIASICSVYNGKLEIGEEEYKWAESEVMAELDAITHAFKYDISIELDDLSFIVARAIIRSLTGKFTTKVMNTKPEMAKYGMFSFTSIQQILKNNTHLNNINDLTDRNNPKSGLEKVISYMVRSGYLVRVDNTELTRLGFRNPLVYKLTNEFKHYYIDMHFAKTQELEGNT